MNEMQLAITPYPINWSRYTNTLYGFSQLSARTYSRLSTAKKHSIMLFLQIHATPAEEG